MIELDRGRLVRDERSGLYQPDESQDEVAVRLRDESREEIAVRLRDDLGPEITARDTRRRR